MEKQKSLKSLIIGGVAATAVVAGMAAFTLTPNIVSAQDVEAPDRQEERAGFRDRAGDRDSARGEKGAEHSQHLAEALGISVDELDAAQATVAEAAIAQAVADGLITQEQADRMAERAGDSGGRMPMMGGPGRGGSEGSGIDHEALLASELGISVDELQAAQEEARQAGIDQAVADGNLTAEEADLMQAGHALREYIDHEAIMEDVLGLTMDELKAAREEGVSIKICWQSKGWIEKQSRKPCRARMTMRLPRQSQMVSLPKHRLMPFRMAKASADAVVSSPALVDMVAEAVTTAARADSNTVKTPNVETGSTAVMARVLRPARRSKVHGRSLHRMVMIT